MERNVVCQPQNIEVAPMVLRRNALPNDRKLVPLVPNVLERIFSYVSLADNVNCHLNHWLIQSIACSQLHNRLAVPQNGAFVLKWPLCFHNREDSYLLERQFRYSDLLRYNVSSLGLPPAEIAEQIQSFLTGYEAMMLAEVNAAAELGYYSNLKTFMADFGLFDNKMCENEQTLPFVQRGYEDDEIYPQLLFRKTLLLGDWQRWAHTITAVTDSCAESLSHFLFVTDTFARSHIRPLNPVRLPAKFYRGLNFDQMLTKMRNLHTLYMPITDYEEVFDPSQPKCETWRLVRQVPQTQFLSLLQRMFQPHSFCLYDKYEITDNPAKSFTHLALPHALRAAFFSTKLRITPSKSESPCLALRKVIFPLYVYQARFAQASVVRAENEFTTQILQFVNSAQTTRERQERLSVWCDETTTRKADIVLNITDFESALPFVHQNITKALAILLELLRAKQIHPSSVRISLEKFHFGYRYSHGLCWDCMCMILPFFVAGAVDDLVLRSFRLRFDMGPNFSTFSEQLKQWRQFTNAKPSENDDLLFTQQYKLPGITMCVDKVIKIRANHVTAENWIESIEQAIMQYIQVFVCDAVDSRVRRDLSLYLYESLKRIDYKFTIILDIKYRRDAGDRHFLERIRLLMQSQAAKFDERVAREVFGQVLKTADDNDANDIVLLFAWTIHTQVRATWE